MVARIHAYHEIGHIASAHCQNMDSVERQDLTNFQAFDAAVSDWCNVVGKTIPQILRLPDVEYMEMSRHMLDAVLERVRMASREANNDQ